MIAVQLMKIPLDGFFEIVISTYFWMGPPLSEEADAKTWIWWISKLILNLKNVERNQYRKVISSKTFNKSTEGSCLMLLLEPGKSRISQKSHKQNFYFMYAVTKYMAHKIASQIFSSFEKPH